MIGLIVATIGNKVAELSRLFKSLSEQQFKYFYVIIVSQDNHDQVADIVKKFSFDVTQVRLTVRGLAKARNEGLKFIKNGTNIISFPDDDCWFPSFALEKINADFKQRPQNTGICYRIFDPESKQFYKKYKTDTISKMGLMGILKVSSIEIFLNLDVFSKLDICFDERFGLGGMYISGEENIFLADIVKKNEIITYLPEIIVYHKRSHGGHKLSDAVLVGKGALFARIFGKTVGSGLLLVFILKKISDINLKRLIPNTIGAYRTLVSLKVK